MLRREARDLLVESCLGAPGASARPEWRATAIFTRDGVETLISLPAIPLDRRIVYALELLAGVRTSEAAAL